MATYYAIKNAKGRYLKIRPLSMQWVTDFRGASIGTEKQMQACLDALNRSPYHGGYQLMKVGESDSAWKAKLEKVNRIIVTDEQQF